MPARRRRFNPRPRVGGDRRVGAISPGDGMFQSAPPRGGRPGAARTRGASGGVSIRAPAWGATVVGYIQAGFWRFQSAPPRGGRPAWHRGLAGPAGGFQSAPPRGGRPCSAQASAPSPFVSIRAPAWGATPRPAACPPGSRFQSAPPRGGRRRPWWSASPPGWVSIRAPAWGATLARGTIGVDVTRFNPRPRVGGDQVHERGLAGIGRFNPRPRVGGDRFRRRIAAEGKVSIRAPAWGATKVRRKKKTITRFQSAPPRGGRRPHRLTVDKIGPVSIRAPAWGATPLSSAIASCG